MENSSTTSLVCSADVAAFVDALETINYNEPECYDPGENVVICISEPEQSQLSETPELSVAEIEEACAGAGGNFFNPDTRKLKAIMQQLVAQKKAQIIPKVLNSSKGYKQFKSDVWNWFGDVRLFISENDAERLKIPYYVRTIADETVMICKVFVGCFRCSALFMYDAQKHSTSTLRYHVRACNRPKECIYVSEENELPSTPEKPSVEGVRQKRFRTDPRKQKEVIEQLFQKQRACITKKSFMNMKGNRRFKSDVWNWFGDVKLLISRSEAKKLKIPYYIRRCGDEQMVLSKIFVGCFKCMALFIHDSQKSTSTLRYHIRTCSRPKERKKRSTPNIIFFPNKSKMQQLNLHPQDSESDAILAHEKLLNFLLSAESSPELIRDPHFHQILQMCITVGAVYGDVNVDSLLCATPTLTSLILNDLYVSSINAFYTEFQHAYGATYRPVVWIDEQIKCPFVSIYCNYVDSEGELKTVVIHTDDFDYETKTPENVHEWFACFLSDQPVIPFKRLLCVDNESHLLSAFRDESCVQCVVQNLTATLQAVASKGATSGDLPDFTNLLSNCVDVVDYCEQVCEQYPLSGLVKCADDKWMSILALFRSIESQYDDILSVLNETSATHLLSVDKPTLTAVAQFFKVFEEAIGDLSEVNEPTLNLVVPWIARLLKHCSVEKRDPAALKQLKSNLALEMDERLLKNVTVYHRMATLLDPRFRKLSLGDREANVKVEHREATLKAKYLVKECMESPNMDSEHTFDSGRSEKAAMEEVDKYISSVFHLAGNDVSQPFPVLKWWKQHSDVYPNLSRIAHWLLSCPAATVGREDTFWSNGWLVHCPRLPVQHDIVNKILFVKTFKGI